MDRETDERSAMQFQAVLALCVERSLCVGKVKVDALRFIRAVVADLTTALVADGRPRHEYPD